MFENDYQYFPSLREIRDSLIKAQMKVLEAEKENWGDYTQFELMKEEYAKKFTLLFDVADLGNLDKPLTS